MLALVLHLGIPLPPVLPSPTVALIRSTKSAFLTRVISSSRHATPLPSPPPRALAAPLPSSPRVEVAAQSSQGQAAQSSQGWARGACDSPPT